MQNITHHTPSALTDRTGRVLALGHTYYDVNDPETRFYVGIDGLHDVETHTLVPWAVWTEDYNWDAKSIRQAH